MMNSRTRGTVSREKVLVIGVGNWYRSDDAVGLMLAERIGSLRLPGVTVREESGEGGALMEAWKGFDHVILIDATSSGSPPGSIRCFNCVENIPARSLRCSSHIFGVVEAVELTRVLGTLPGTLMIYGIEGEDFSFGTELSPLVSKAVGVVESMVIVRAGHSLETI